MDEGSKRVAEIFADAVRLHERVAAGAAGSIASVAAVIARALARGGKVLVFGNGGSAADAQHFAAELMGRFVRERKALPALALTTDTSALTAIGNDYGFDRVFVRQVEALGRPGDVAVGISTSGRSANVLAALEHARAAGLTTVALTGGDGGPIGNAVEWHLNVPQPVTARVQEVHMTILHAVAELVEQWVTSSG